MTHITSATVKITKQALTFGIPLCYLYYQMTLEEYTVKRSLY